MTATDYDGRAPLHRVPGAPKPSRFDELVAAHTAGDVNLVAELEDQYLREEARDR